MKKRIILSICLILFIVLIITLFNINNKKHDIILNNDYNMNIIKIINNKESGNYLISPYSIEIALNMLKEGADGETLNQIDKVLSERNITYFDVNNKVSVANAIFIKNDEKKIVSDDYISKIKSVYKSDLIYDEFKTPYKINKWVKEKTYDMIPKILDTIPKDFVLGISNAVAIDVEWQIPFECINTHEEDFTTTSGVKKVEMMSNNYSDISYILNDTEKGIILPYHSYNSDGEIDYDNSDNSTKLEFIAIMPTKKDVKSYINDLTAESLGNIIDSQKSLEKNQELNLDIPRFEYDYNDSHFMKDLIDLGIKDVFDPELSNLSKMISKDSDEKLYVSEAIHMTHISLNERGTKAAAVTYFGLSKATAMIEKKEYINIEFNKPFMYIIRDGKSKEMLFFGVLETPNEWKGSTCNN